MRDKIRFHFSSGCYVDDFMKEFLLKIKNNINKEDILFEHKSTLIYKSNNVEVSISNVGLDVHLSNIEEINIEKFINILLQEHKKLKDLYEQFPRLYEFTIFTNDKYCDEVRKQLIELEADFTENNFKSFDEMTYTFCVCTKIKFYK